jgi:hypothetical protein
MQLPPQLAQPEPPDALGGGREQPAQPDACLTCGSTMAGAGGSLLFTTGIGSAETDTGAQSALAGAAAGGSPNVGRPSWTCACTAPTVSQAAVRNVASLAVLRIAGVRDMMASFRHAPGTIGATVTSHIGGKGRKLCQVVEKLGEFPLAG